MKRNKNRQNKNKISINWLIGLLLIIVLEIAALVAIILAIKTWSKNVNSWANTIATFAVIIFTAISFFYFNFHLWNRTFNTKLTSTFKGDESISNDISTRIVEKLWANKEFQKLMRENQTKSNK